MPSPIFAMAGTPERSHAMRSMLSAFSPEALAERAWRGVFLREPAVFLRVVCGSGAPHEV